MLRLWTHFKNLYYLRFKNSVSPIKYLHEVQLQSFRTVIYLVLESISEIGYAIRSNSKSKHQTIQKACHDVKNDVADAKKIRHDAKRFAMTSITRQ